VIGMDFVLVDTYLHSLAYTDHYTLLPEEDREKIAFTANEMLLNYYSEPLVTSKIIALQTLYMIEGEGDEFAKMKRQRVKSFGLKGISFSFDQTGGESSISPDVIALIEQASKTISSGAFVGRLA
jgi:hypothetical protein